jgi:hypothetical protein
MKRLIAALALSALAFPAGALADPHGLRVENGGQSPLQSAQRDLRLHNPHVRSGSLAVVPPVLARGTDVAATDQQSPKVTPKPAPAPLAEGSDFDWGDAGIGAGSAFCLMFLSAGSAVALRRRRGHPSALAS